MHRSRFANFDAGGLSRNPCINQEYDIGARWRDEIDEKMVLDWHASALRGKSTKDDHLTSYSSQRVDEQSSEYEIEDDAMDQRDIYNNALILEFIWRSMVPNTMSVKERDREIVFSSTRRDTDWSEHMFSECGRIV